MDTLAESPCYVLTGPDGLVGQVTGKLECDSDPEGPDDNSTTPPEGCWMGIGEDLMPCDDNQTCLNGRLSDGTPCESCIDGKNSYGMPCDDNATEPPACEQMQSGGTLPDGLFTAALGWGNDYVDIGLSNGLMDKQIQGCGYVALSSGNKTLFDIYPGVYPIQASASPPDSVDENVSDTVVFAAKVMDDHLSTSFKIDQKSDYGQIGHIADIIITRPNALMEPTIRDYPENCWHL